MGNRSKGKVALSEKKSKHQNFWIVFIPVLAFLIKMIVMSNSVKGGWLGADGENYLTAVDGLRADGFFSESRNLHYWPAGYSIFIWPLTILSLNNFLYILSIVQGLLFAFATYFFTMQLTRTRLASLVVGTSFLISFNPTLSLSSNVVGYETPAAALLMLSIGFLIKSKIDLPEGFSFKWAVLSALSVGVSCFFQPRNILFAFAISLIYTFTLTGKELRIKFATISLIVIMIFPAVLVARNLNAIDSATISTNLGTTMFIGMGDGATGGYNSKYNGVPCPAADNGTESQIDSAKVKCALVWYLKNPSKTVSLAAKKSIFYWSPWFGPEAEGTMARNPWLKISPAKNGIKTQQNYDAVYGPLGIVTSWLWILGQLVLLFTGIIWLWRMGGLEKIISKLAAAPVLLGWLISMGTIGDHRFRLPQMGLSLFLQAAGFVFFKRKITKVL